MGVRYLYTLVFYALVPALLGRLLWKGRLLSGRETRWLERFGFFRTPPAWDVVWFHAVSVGESEAAFPLIKSLLNRDSGLTVLVTCTTPSGSARIQEVLGNRVLHVYLPYDLPGAVRRFLNHFRPRLGVIMETEIWPNLYQACRARQCPLVMVNGRLSDDSTKGYAWLRKLTRESLAAVHSIAAQTPLDAERYIAIGAAPERVKVLGNVKFDIDFDAEMQTQAARLRRELFQDRPVWIAGSTHPGEEELILEALASIREAVKDLVLIFAPRHPERASQVRSLCAGRGLKVTNRSERKPCAPDTAIFLIDGIGELRTFYGTADVAFIGGSLIPHGGQNVLEAAVAGIPVVFGPHTMNFREITARLLSAGGGTRVEDPVELARAIIGVFEIPALATEQGQKARAFVMENRGAVNRVTELLLEQLSPATATVTQG